MNYKIGSRGSRLALVQAESVRDRLAAAYPEHQFEIVIVKTVGDRDTSSPMRQLGTTGIFTKELEEQLYNGSIDLAVHSMKDLPAVLPEGLALCNVMSREDPRDVLVTPDGKHLSQLPQGATLGTGSLRRKYQLLALRPDLNIVDIRGNIETRLRKMQEQHMDGIVLAAAAMLRLGYEDRIGQFFSPDQLIPAPTQGVLGAEYRSDRTDIAAMLEGISDREIRPCVDAERSFLSVMQVGCHMPVAAHCTREEGLLKLRVLYGSEDGSDLRFAEARGTDPELLAQEAARQVR